MSKTLAKNHAAEIHEAINIQLIAKNSRTKQGGGGSYEAIRLEKKRGTITLNIRGNEMRGIEISISPENEPELTETLQTCDSELRMMELLEALFIKVNNRKGNK